MSHVPCAHMCPHRDGRGAVDQSRGKVARLAGYVKSSRLMATFAQPFQVLRWQFEEGFGIPSALRCLAIRAPCPRYFSEESKPDHPMEGQKWLFGSDRSESRVLSHLPSCLSPVSRHTDRPVRVRGR